MRTNTYKPADGSRGNEFVWWATKGRELFAGMDVHMCKTHRASFGLITKRRKRRGL